MGTKVHHIEAFPGIKDLYALIEIINDKKKYSNALEEMESLRKDLNDKIDLIGKVDEIERLRSESVNLKKQAQDLLTSANEKASKSIEDASSKAEEIVQFAKDREAKSKEKQKSLEDMESRNMRELKAKEDRLNEQFEALKKREVDASNLYDKARLLKQTYEDAVEKLKKAGVKIAV